MSIEIRNVSKNFNAFKALDDINLDIQSGELVACSALRVRQDHPAADHRRAGNPGRRQHRVPWRGRLAARRARPQRRLRLPALRAVPPHDGVRQRRLRPAHEAQGRAAGRVRDQGQGPRAAQHGAARLARRPLSRAALRWPAAAYRPGPRAGGGAEDPAPRRTLRRPRRQGTQGAAPLAGAPARGDQPDLGVRHPRPGRSDGSGRPHRGDEQGRDRADRLARRGLREPGQRFRLPLPRRLQPPATGQRPAPAVPPHEVSLSRSAVAEHRAAEVRDIRPLGRSPG